MNIIRDDTVFTGIEYYQKLNSQALDIFEECSSNTNVIGEVHDLKANIRCWIQVISNSPSAGMLEHSIEEIDVACIQILQGLYRGGFSSLRLALETLCGSIYFSAHDIEFVEWKNGGRDIIWGKLSCPENGVLSVRFCNAYFPELSGIAPKYIPRIKSLYRKLSEMVHGNSLTRSHEIPELSYKPALVEEFIHCLNEFKVLSNLILSVRFFKKVNYFEFEDLEVYICDSLQDIEPIRILLGGPADE